MSDKPTEKDQKNHELSDDVKNNPEVQNIIEKLKKSLEKEAGVGKSLEAGKEGVAMSDIKGENEKKGQGK